LKAQNVYNKMLWKPKNTYNKPWLETTYLGETLINLLKQKVGPKVAIVLGNFILSKDHIEPTKVAQLAKKMPDWQKMPNLVTLIS
jgi:hypothetical protein